MSPKYFGPFPILAKVGNVAYKLQLPPGPRVHPTFHMSQLKKHVGAALVQSVLPIVDTRGAWIKEPARILDQRMVFKGNQVEIEVLGEWLNTFPEDATWESLEQLKLKYPLILEDKDADEERGSCYERES